MTTASPASHDDPSSFSSHTSETLSRRGMLWLGLVSVLATGILYSIPRISFRSLRLLDVDGYMRAQRVVDLIAGDNSWFDSWVYRANAPFGHSLHWTRPVDAALVALSWPFTWFTELKEAVYVGSYLFGPVMVVSIFFAVAWAARALLSPGASYLAAAATAFQLGLVAYNAPGHPDHHGLILLFSALLVGHTLRLLQADSRVMAIRAGAVAGLGLWVATEFLFPLAICLVVLLLRWIVAGSGLASLQVFTTSLLGALVVAIALEREPQAWFEFQSDRVSAIHLAMAGLLVISSWLFGRISAASLRKRLLLASLTGGIAAGILQWLFPGFFLGPVLAIEPSVERFFDEYITELAPTWRSVGHEWAGMALLLGAPLLAVAQGIERWRANRRIPASNPWALIVFWLVTSLALAVASFRYVPMAELLAGIPLAAGVQQRLSRPDRRRPVFVRPILILWCLLGYLLLVVAGSALGGGSNAGVAAACGLEEIEDTLARSLRRSPTADPVVLAAVPNGPELLWRLPVRVVGSPYHPNVTGIEFTQEIFSTRSLDRAVALLAERDVSVIVVCKNEPASEGYRNPGSFYSLLLSGKSIAGWQLVTLPQPSAFRIYIRS